MSKALFLGGLTEKQWFALGKLHEQMQDHYRMRRETLIKRLDVTIQSFKWGERLKSMEDKIMQVYQPRRRLMEAEPNVSLGHVLAAREDLAIIDKTSGASVRKNTKSAVNRVMIGAVPDRGGRPEEQQPPPPEMPSWQKRTDGPQGGRGGGTSFSSGRIQGAGWDNNQRADGMGQRGAYGQQSGGRGDGHYGGRGGGYSGSGGGYRGGGHTQRDNRRDDYSSGGGGYGGGGQRRDDYGRQDGGYGGGGQGYGQREGYRGGGGYRGKRGGRGQDR